MCPPVGTVAPGGEEQEVFYVLRETSHGQVLVPVLGSMTDRTKPYFEEKKDKGMPHDCHRLRRHFGNMFPQQTRPARAKKVAGDENERLPFILHRLTALVPIEKKTSQSKIINRNKIKY